MPDAPGLTQRLLDVRDRCEKAASGSAADGGGEAWKQEMRALSGCIAAALRAMEQMEVQDIIKLHVPAATDQLDAIVSRTARATDAILDQCEKLDRAAADMRSRPDVSAATARIYEACSFQDMTGQHVARVTEVLQAIEAKSGEILRIMGSTLGQAIGRPIPPALLNGPQHPRTAMGQAAVDDLIGSLL